MGWNENLPLWLSLVQVGDCWWYAQEAIMCGLDIGLRRIRTLMGFQREGPLSGVYIMRGGAVGGEHSCATNPSCSHPSSPQNPRRVHGASTPVTSVPAPYVWTLRRCRCIVVVLIGRTRRRRCKPWSASSSPTHDYVGSSYPNSTCAALRI
jgi:hypothetical protein